MKPLDALRAEAAEFRAAVAAAPEPTIGWDVLGLRRWGHKAWWRLLRVHVEPPRLALAVFVGVIIGTSPFFGLHLVLCLLAAFTLRLNKLAVWLAANVSLPFFAPFLAFASAQVGHFLLHGRWSNLDLASLEEAGLRGLLWLWILGFPFVGAALGAVMAAIVWRLAELRHRRGRGVPPRGEPGSEER